jgi:hypothetical protein
MVARGQQLSDRVRYFEDGRSSGKNIMSRVWKKVVAKRSSVSAALQEPFTRTFHKDERFSFNETVPFHLCIAVYESALSPPRVVVVQGDGFAEFMETVGPKAYDLAQNAGSLLPQVVFKELLENLIHSGPLDAVVTIQDSGNTLTVSDSGPGIKFPEKALQPGFTTATQPMRRYIRGVGAGLPVVNEILEKMGGVLTIGRNLSGGAVVKASVQHAAAALVQRELSLPSEQKEFRYGKLAGFGKRNGGDLGLSDREKHVLLLFAEVDSIGPSRVAKELDISLSTAHRDLAKLERHSLVCSLPHGKKKLTKQGLGQLELIFSASQSTAPVKEQLPSQG